jgi:hypothetical protein
MLSCVDGMGEWRGKGGERQRTVGDIVGRHIELNDLDAAVPR